MLFACCCWMMLMFKKSSRLSSYDMYVGMIKAKILNPKIYIYFFHTLWTCHSLFFFNQKAKKSFIPSSSPISTQHAYGGPVGTKKCQVWWLLKWLCCASAIPVLILPDTKGVGGWGNPGYRYFSWILYPGGGEDEMPGRKKSHVHSERAALCDSIGGQRGLR